MRSYESPIVNKSHSAHHKYESPITKLTSLPDSRPTEHALIDRSNDTYLPSNADKHLLASKNYQGCSSRQEIEEIRRRYARNDVSQNKKYNKYQRHLEQQNKPEQCSYAQPKHNFHKKQTLLSERQKESSYHKSNHGRKNSSLNPIYQKLDTQSKTERDMPTTKSKPTRESMYLERIEEASNSNYDETHRDFNHEERGLVTKRKNADTKPISHRKTEDFDAYLPNGGTPSRTNSEISKALEARLAAYSKSFRQSEDERSRVKQTLSIFNESGKSNRTIPRNQGSTSKKYAKNHSQLKSEAQQSAQKGSMRSTHLYSNGREKTIEGSELKDLDKFSVAIEPNRLANKPSKYEGQNVRYAGNQDRAEDNNRLKEIERRLEERTRQYKQKEKQLKEKYAQHSQAKYQRSETKINEFRLSESVNVSAKADRATKCSSKINEEIERIDNKIKEFDQKKKELNIQCRPLLKDNANSKSSYSIERPISSCLASKRDEKAGKQKQVFRDRGVSLHTKTNEVNANSVKGRRHDIDNGEEVNHHRRASEAQYTQETDVGAAIMGKRRTCSFIENTVPMYSQHTLPPKKKDDSQKEWGFELFRIESETEESSEAISKTPSSSSLLSRNKSFINHNSNRSYSINLSIENRTNNGIQERKKRLQIDNYQKIQKRQTLKNLVSLLSQQCVLDEDFRNAKIWFSSVTGEQKWNKLKMDIERFENDAFLSHISTLANGTIEQFVLTEQENNPFFSVNQTSKFSNQKLLESFSKCQKHWSEKIQNKMEKDSLSSENFTMQRLDLDKKGYIEVEDLVRFLNIQSGSFYRNRDLALIFKRLKKGAKQGRENCLSFSKVWSNLTF